MKKSMWDWIEKIAITLIAVMTIGIIIPTLLTRYQQEKAIQTYISSISSESEDRYTQAIADAQQYNSLFYQTQGAMVGNTQEILSDESYEQLLNVNGDSLMGMIEIPKINVNLPIYHGTADEVLEVGVGHVRESSLPVGGENTRSVLTGHRGLPSAKLFSRLDELVEGDLFFIRIGDVTFAYQVFEIEVIKPEEVERLEIVPEKDLVSLVTCTPYGVNTHRLVVTGERVSYDKAEYDSIQVQFPSLRETFLTALFYVILPLSLIGVFIKKIIQIFKERREKKNETQENVLLSGRSVDDDNNDRENIR